MYDDSHPRTLKNRVRERRRELGLTQDALAKRVGAARQTINKVERQPGYHVAKTLCMRLAAALTVDEAWLFFSDPPPYSVRDDADVEES